MTIVYYGDFCPLLRMLLQMVTFVHVRIYVCIISYCTYNDHVQTRDGLIRTGLIYDSTVAQNDREVSERERESDWGRDRV